MDRRSAEETYYRAHYGGGVAPNSTPLDVFEREMLGPGKRYHLAIRSLPGSLAPDALVVELGCGGGETLAILRGRHAFRRLIGIDIAVSDEPVSGEGIAFLSANLNGRWPLEDGSVDCLLAMMVIEHLFDPFHAFAEVRRVLAPTGVAFINLPLVTGLRNRVRLVSGRLPTTSIGYARWFDRKAWDGNHLHYFSLDSIERLTRATGLELGEIAGVGRWHRLKTRLPTLLAGEITFAVTCRA
jgi:SAM-dependent methyltransferase